MVSGGGTFAWPEPAVLGDDGSFVADHLPTGTVTVAVMAYASGSYASPGPGVTSLTGIRVSVRSGPQSYFSFAGRARPLPVTAGPRLLAATTRDDGGYELDLEIADTTASCSPPARPSPASQSAAA